MKTVCITQQDDGSFTVELENEMSEGSGLASDAVEAPEGTSQDMAEDKAEGETESVYASLDEALAAVAALFDGPAGEEPMMDGEDSFVQGFKGARGIEQGF